MFEQRQAKEQQQEIWIVAGELPSATPEAFYKRVNRTLEQMDFAPQVWAICKPAYAEAAKGGRPGIDPVVYLKMLMVGFFENIGSERGIASRCADSLSIRGFLGYSLTEGTPDHSSLSVIRERLSLEQMQAMHRVLLSALHQHGLLKGRKTGIDSSIIEANASLRGLEHRNTEESYWEYVKRLAAAAGIDPQDTKAVRRFDKKRTGRKTSTTPWPKWGAPSTARATWCTNPNTSATWKAARSSTPKCAPATPPTTTSHSKSASWQHAPHSSKCCPKPGAAKP